MLRVILSAALLTGGLAAPAQAASSCTYVVNPPYPANLRVRSGPGTGYEVVGAIPYQGTVQGSCGSNGAWTQVWGGGCSGWAYAPYLDPL